MRKTNKNIIKIQKRWRQWKFKNVFFLLVSLVVFAILTIYTPLIDHTIKYAGNLGYLGAFVVGIFFTSTFTVVPASFVLFHMADILHPVEVALLAGAGAMIGDYVIFRFIKDRVFKELLPVIRKLHTPRRIKLLFKSPFFAWLVPLIGGLIIASPLPDEVGISMLGLSKIKKWQFFLLVFVLNAVGVFLIVSVARLIP